MLDALDGQARHLVHIDQPPLFLVEKIIAGFMDLDFAFFGLAAQKAGEDFLELDADFLDAAVGKYLER